MSTNNPPSMHTFDEPKLEAIVELMVLAAAADGEFSEEERRHFLSSVESLTDRRVAGDGLDRLVSRIEADLRAGGRHARLLAVRERLASPALRKAAFTMAAQVTAADGIIRTSEREWLLELADALEIDRDLAADMVAKIAP